MSTNSRQPSSREPLRPAINAMCRSCIYDPAAPGTALQQIIDCPCYHCPLYHVRPNRPPSKQKAEQDNETRSC